MFWQSTEDPGKAPASGGAPPTRRVARPPFRTRNPWVDRFGLVLILLLASIFVSAIAGDQPWGPVVVLLALSATTYTALRAADVHRRWLRVAVAVIPILCLAGIVVTVVGDDAVTRSLIGSMTVMLVLVTPPAILARFRQHPVVSGQTFAAAVSVYLLIAMLFATLYALVAIFTGEPFFVQTETAAGFDYLYFSFVTIATVGYGDYTAATDVGRAMAILEMILGQLYLISVVALVVNNLGRERERKLHEPEDRGDVAEAPTAGDDAEEG
jgi:hypothetical protein